MSDILDNPSNEEVIEEIELTPKERKIIDRIKLMLGSSVLKIEISDKDIKELIGISLDTVAPYIVDYKYITVPYQSSISLEGMNVEEVLRVIPGSRIGTTIDTEIDFGFEFSQAISFDKMQETQIYSMMQRKINPDVDIPFEFDSETKTLMLGTTYVSDMVTLECVPEVLTIEDLRDKATQKWIYLYTLALAKEVVGRIRSKAKSTNIPIELDGDTLLNEAATEKSSLENSLMADQTGPIAILR